MEQLNIHCFGTLNITKNGQLITQFDTDKARALLVYLVLEHRRRLTRSHLAGLLWSELSEKQALQSLRQTLLIIRKSLGDFSSQPLIISEKDVLFINPEIPIWTDVFVFQNELSEAIKFFQRQDQFHRINFRQLKKAIRIKTGTFLDNFSIASAYLFDEWVSLTRESLDHQAADGMNLLVQYHLNRAEYGMARNVLQQILQITPWNEPVHLMLMRIYANDGQWSAFENQFRLLRKFLKNEIGVEPSADTMAFYQEVRNKQIDVTIPTKENINQPNLINNASSFVGREKELDEITSLLTDPTCRLITLHGPGGIGKTSLAQEIIKQQRGVYQDGEYFVSLAGIQTNDAMISELIEVLQVPLLDTTITSERIRDFVRNKSILLVLDNIEQLLEAPENINLLTTIVHHSANSKILVTSRERLNMNEEWVYPINGLSYPDPSNLEILESVEKYDALVLFQQRATQVKQDFQLDQQSITAAVEICRLYEGLPLAIELAAADVWSQSCHLIADKIRGNLNSLHANTRNGTTRHNTLWANLDDSWSRMDKKLKSIFTIIGIFEDDFSFEAANSICFCEYEDLKRLVNQSLIQLNPHGRYRAHNLIQQYAQEKLKLSGMINEVRLRFIQYYVGYLKQFLEGDHTIYSKHVLDGVQVELRNLKRAWQMVIELGNIDQIEVFFEPLSQFFHIRSRFQEGIEFFQPALDLLFYLNAKEKKDQHEILLGKVLLYSGSLAHRARENNLARDSLERAKEIFSKNLLREELINCQMALADVYLRSNEYLQAEKIAKENLAHFQSSYNKVGQIKALNTLGLVRLRQGEIEGARGYLQRAVEIGRKVDNKRLLIVPLNYLGDIACNEGDYSVAKLLFQESLKIASELEDLYQVALLLNNLASVFHVELDYPKGRVMYQKSLDICRQIGDLNGEAIALTNLGEVALAQENFSEAVALSNQALAISRELGEEWSVSICLNNLSEAYCKLGQIEKATKLIMEAIQIAFRNNAMRFLARYAVTAGRCYQLLGVSETAKEILSAALAHSSIEYDVREKAIGYCREMGINGEVEIDDEKLAEVVSWILGNF